MHQLYRGLCVCCCVLSLASCAQDKKLPTGERLSILDNLSSEVTSSSSQISTLPSSYINNSWPQNGLNSQHIVGNLKAGGNLKEVWSQNFGKGINKRDILLPVPVTQNNRIFVMDAKGIVSAYSIFDGTELWKNSLTTKSLGFKDTNSRASGLAVDNMMLYATTGFGGVYAMDAISGSPKWRKVLESPIRIAPTITQNMILVQTVDNKLYALNKITGEELWRFGVAHEDTVIAGGASPAFDAEENVVVAGFSNGEIVVLNSLIGTPLWSHMLVSNKQVSSTTELNSITSYPIVENGTIYAISNSNVMVALDLRTGDTLWQNEIGSTQNMLLVGDYLFTISNKNVLYAVDKNDGTIIWSLNMKDYLDVEEQDGEVYAADPIMIDGNILLAFSNGKVFKINASKGKVAAKTDLNMDISNGLIVVNKHVITISDNADIYTLE